MLLENIIRLCRKRRLSISRLERETGISNGTISRWGRVSPTVENVQKVARYLGTTVDALLAEAAPDPEEGSSQK